MGPEPRPPIDRFLEKIEQSPNGCWLWTAACFASGYGAFRVGRKQRRAHRWAYEHYIGPVGPDDVVMHACDTPRCVNPAHLRLGTHLENQQDMTAKGRGRTGVKNGTVSSPRKLSPAIADEIRAIYLRGGISQTQLGLRFGISQTMVGLIVRNERWRNYEPAGPRIPKG